MGIADRWGAFYHRVVPYYMNNKPKETTMIQDTNDLVSHKEKRMYVNLFYDLGYAYKHDKVLAPESEILVYLEMLRREPVYRVQLNKDGTVFTECYDLMESFSPELNKSYDTIDELPKWVQDKLAVLMLLDYNKSNNDIPSIGRRITKDIFWIFTRDGEVDGNDPRG